MKKLLKERFDVYVSMYLEKKNEYEDAREKYRESFDNERGTDLDDRARVRKKYEDAEETFNSYAKIFGDFIIENLDHIELK